MSDLIIRETAIFSVHETIHQFIEDNETFTDRDELLLKVNKAICNGLRDIPIVAVDPTVCDKKMELLLKECSEHPAVYNKVSNILYKDLGLQSAEISLTCTYAVLKFMELSLKAMEV